MDTRVTAHSENFVFQSWWDELKSTDELALTALNYYDIRSHATQIECQMKYTCSRRLEEGSKSMSMIFVSEHRQRLQFAGLRPTT